ncbi:MAG: FAD:protein FMN transferase [Spirochaetaceae bacterium]|nr:FAD:protein FMN transferase [Spirochaetaceae bacterium]
MNGTAVAAVAIILTACAPRAAAEISRTEYVLGTFCTIRLVKGGSPALIDRVWARLRQLENDLTVNQAGSQIDSVNKAAGERAVAIGQDAIAILKKDLRYASISDGAFDPSVGPLVKLWGIGTERAAVPSAKDREEALKLVGWKDIVLDENAGTIFLRRKGMALDLGSGTKGYAADLAVDMLRAGGVKSAIIDLGGNVFALGAKTDGKPWRIGLQNPFSTRGDYLGIASLTDQTMVTSGIYERFFEKDGKHYHHILDTRTGFPVDNGLVSVTVIAPKSFDADGFTTTLFAVGRQKALELGKATGVDVIIVDAARKVYMSSGVSNYFEITDPAFTLAE